MTDWLEVSFLVRGLTLNLWAEEKERGCAVTPSRAWGTRSCRLTAVAGVPSWLATSMYRPNQPLEKGRSGAALSHIAVVWKWDSFGWGGLTPVLMATWF